MKIPTFEDKCPSCSQREHCEIYVLSNMGIFEIEPITSHPKCIHLTFFKEDLEKQVYKAVWKWWDENREIVLKYLNTPKLNPAHPCYGCCHYDGCGYFDLYDTNKTEEENFIEHCVGCCCGDGCECNRASDEGCSNYEIDPILG